jgi:hypothetical protein
VVGFEIGQHVVDKMRPVLRLPRLEHANSISTTTSSVDMSASTLRETPCSAINITNAQVHASVRNRAPEHKRGRTFGRFNGPAHILANVQFADARLRKVSAVRLMTFQGLNNRKPTCLRVDHDITSLVGFPDFNLHNEVSQVQFIYEYPADIHIRSSKSNLPPSIYCDQSRYAGISN